MTVEPLPPRREVHPGDCLEVLPRLAAAGLRADAMVTDPPAAIGYLGHRWDTFRGGRAGFVAWLAPRLAAARQVLRPGAPVAVWSIPRTSHWTALAVEDAGFEIADMAVHLYGQGMPKAPSLLKPAAEYWHLAFAPGRPRGPLARELCKVNGREPANATFEHAPDCADGGCTPGCAVAALDTQSGVLRSGSMKAGTPRRNRDCYSGDWGETGATKADIVGDAGGASRFFYCAKARFGARVGHPTEKPVDLMRRLCRLVCPPGGTVVDPFAGSGATLVAAEAEGMRAVGIEADAAWVAKAARR